jgi:RNA methyltransferase, TrmH family
MSLKEIASKDNEKIKFLRKLNQKKYRDKEGSFFVENLKIINDGIASGFYPESLFLTEEFFNKNKTQIKNILSKIALDDCYLVNEIINKSFTSLENPSGVCAVYKKQSNKVEISEPIIYLNGIVDPGNLGSIFRSSLAFGFKNIVLDENCVDLYNSKVISSAKDSIFKLRIEIDKNFVLLKKIKKKMNIFATRLENGESIKKLKRRKHFCLVLGSESHGISKEVEKMADNFIKINMSNKIESLNVSVSAAIIFHYYYSNN